VDDYDEGPYIDEDIARGFAMAQAFLQSEGFPAPTPYPRHQQPQQQREHAQQGADDRPPPRSQNAATGTTATSGPDNRAPTTGNAPRGNNDDNSAGRRPRAGSFDFERGERRLDEIDRRLGAAMMQLAGIDGMNGGGRRRRGDRRPPDPTSTDDAVDEVLDQIAAREGGYGYHLDY
jgi:hypothetical protein